jgi:hypothetical protein
MNPTHHTCSCGYTWGHGRDGSHHCSFYYQKTIVELRAALAAKTEAPADWAEDAAWMILKLKDRLAERGGRPTTDESATKLWDEACDIYLRMVQWANDPKPAVQPVSEASSLNRYSLVRGFLESSPDGRWCSYLEAMAIIGRQGAAVPCDRDAVRYRWLRERGFGLPKLGAELDAAIDTALAQQHAAPQPLMDDKSGGES